MRVVLSTTVQAHTFDFAKELQKRGELTALFSGYPKSKLAARGLVGPEIRSFPLPVLAGLAMNRLAKSQKSTLRSEPWPKVLFDRYVARHLPDCDLFVATSSVGLASGRVAKKKGAFWVCDRPCSHILTQNRLLTEEYELNDMKWPGISPRIIERELAEYQEADAVLVASSFAQRSFVQEHGFPAERLWKVPYGVDLSKFYPDGEPDPAFLTVLFAGSVVVQKGITYLVRAIEQVKHLPVRLRVAGGIPSSMVALAAKWAQNEKVAFLGHLSQSELVKEMGRADILVHPSIQEGMALVQAQALACGCPVICTTNSGGEDLLGKGSAGWVVPIRDPDSIATILETLCADRKLLADKRCAARRTSDDLGGWGAYLDSVLERLAEVRPSVAMLS